MNKTIPFNKPFQIGTEMEYMAKAYNNGKLSGDGEFTKKCQQWLEQNIGCKRALLTHSCTAALEMAALLIDLKPGDEVIMPSYTFVSTANAFVLRGAIPVFVDIRPDTLNLNEKLIEDAITDRTKAIVPVHYAGVGCEMNAIMAIAEKHHLYVIEDAAQGILASINGKPLGSQGHLAALSFHDTKNIISGEGGALLINDPKLIERAEIIREKGTNRARFFRGQVDKYTWVDVGSSYLPSELIAAHLWGQLEQANTINNRRMEIWNRYYEAFQDLDYDIQIQFIPENCQHNAHMFYILLSDLETRSEYIEFMKTKGIQCVFHYIPLHSSPAGKEFGRSQGELTVTDSISERLVRLPIWIGLEQEFKNVTNAATLFFEQSRQYIKESI